MGFQVLPASSVRKAPAAEMAMTMRSGLVGREDDGVEAEAACAGLPVGAGFVEAEAGELVPGVAAVGGLEEAGVFGSGVDGVGVGERGLEVPDALELPGVGRAVVPLMRAGSAFVGELVADGGPGEAAVVGALDLLAEPAGGLGGVEAVGVGGGGFEVVELPAGEVGFGDLPGAAGGVGGEDEGAFAGADEEADAGHGGSGRDFRGAHSIGQSVEGWGALLASALADRIQ